MTIEHTWSRDFERAYKLVSNPLDRRALRICEAHIIWNDSFNRKPDAELIAKFSAAELASLATIARQICEKLVTGCQVPLPMPVSVDIVELLQTDDGAIELERSEPRSSSTFDPFDLDRGPRP